MKDARLRAFAAELVPDLEDAESDDPAHIRFGDDADTLAYVITVDAVNFGSGWFPVLHKPEGRSGYFTIATALRRRFEERGRWSAAELESLTPTDCARVFGQNPENPEQMELMSWFARSLSDLGHALTTRADGSFEQFVGLASGRAGKLVESLAEMPLYRDVSDYHGAPVPLYKRAQITVADLALAFGGVGPGHFEDVDDLTMFADNLVPHVLRHEGVLEYDGGLLARIDEGDLLEPGSPEEVEIRAVGLHAVECMAAHLGTRAQDLDRVLWQRGQRPEIKARNRHRARSVFY